MAPTITWGAVIVIVSFVLFMMLTCLPCLAGSILRRCRPPSTETTVSHKHIDSSLRTSTIVEHQSLKESLPSEDIENNHHSSEDGIKGKLEVRYNGSSSHPSDESNNVTEPSVILLTQLVEEGNPECHICLESFHVGEKYSTSNISGCNHGYHQECVSQWLTKKTTCPSCRNTFVSAKRCGSKTYRDTSESYPINTNNNSVGTSVALASTTHPTTRREI